MFVYYSPPLFFRNLKRVFFIPILMYIVACTLINPLFQHTCLYHAIILLIRFIYSYSLSLFVMKISKSMREMFDAYPVEKPWGILVGVQLIPIIFPPIVIYSIPWLLRCQKNVGLLSLYSVCYNVTFLEQINSYLKMDNIYIFFYVKILLKKAAHGSSSTISKEWCTLLVYTFNETLNTVKRRCWMLKVWV